MKILVTGFEPFGMEKINPSYEVVKRLDSRILDSDIIKLQVPTVFYKSINTVIKTIKEETPDVILMIGQAGGRYNITVERIGININDARIQDNEGNKPMDEVIDNEGLPAYFSSIPVRKIVEELIKNNIPASISNSAGTYVCNHLLYGILDYIYKNKLGIKAGFIHIPFLPEQILNRADVPSMSLEMMIKAIDTAISVCVDQATGYNKKTGS